MFGPAMGAMSAGSGLIPQTSTSSAAGGGDPVSGNVSFGGSSSTSPAMLLALAGIGLALLALLWRPSRRRSSAKGGRRK